MNRRFSEVGVLSGHRLRGPGDAVSFRVLGFPPSPLPRRNITEVIPSPGVLPRPKVQPFLARRPDPGWHWRLRSLLGKAHTCPEAGRTFFAPGRGGDDAVVVRLLIASGLTIAGRRSWRCGPGGRRLVGSSPPTDRGVERARSACAAWLVRPTLPRVRQLLRQGLSLGRAVHRPSRRPRCTSWLPSERPHRPRARFPESDRASSCQVSAQRTPIGSPTSRE
jgi:hypothetical protein